MNKTKLPRFMIAHNVAADPDGLYVVHTQYPMFIAKVLPQTGEIQRIGELMEQYPIAARTNPINGTYYIIAVVKWIDELHDATPDNVDITAKLMSRTGDWFFNYIKNLPNEYKK